MIFSMTGFATASRELAQGTLTLELRTVNHRYLDIQFRLGDEFRMLEAAMRELIGKHMTRGKVDCRINFTPQVKAQSVVQLNEPLLVQLVELNRKVQEYSPQSQTLRVLDVLRWPGMLAAEEVAIESVHEACLLLLQQTAQELNRVRGREGEKLKSMVAERIHQVELLVGEVMPHIPRLVATYQERLQTRLAEAGLNGDDDRIRQEISLFAQRIDVDEEISRLKAHVGEVKRVLQDGGVVGKRLDFLMQELNREANTLGAKSASGEVSRISMEMKVLIEQMREQIQNIE